MVIVPASAAVPQGFTFTVGQITWTTRGGGLTTTTSEETQIRSGTAAASTPTTPTPSTRPSLPRYRGKKIDDSDLFQALDRADLRLLEASQLVDGISRQSDQAASIDSFDSCRPTRVVTHEQLGMSLTISSTPTGRSVKLKTAPDQSPPYGINNSADHYSRHTQSLFNRAGWSPRQSSRAARHYVNMVSIQVLPNDKATSTNSSTGSVPTEVLNSEDEDYNMDLPPYPLGFSCFPVFPPQRGDLIFNVSNDEPVSTEKQTSRSSSANSAMPTALGDTRMRNGNLRRITSVMLLTWSGINQSTRHRALTWMLLWKTWIDSLILLSARASGPAYAHT